MNRKEISRNLWIRTLLFWRIKTKKGTKS